MGMPGHGGVGMGMPGSVAPAGAAIDKFLPPVGGSRGGSAGRSGSGPGSSHSDQKSSGPGLRYLRMARYQPGQVVQRSPHDSGQGFAPGFGAPVAGGVLSA